MKIKRVFITIILSIFTYTSPLLAQELQEWFHKDPAADRFAGISTDKTYNNLLNGKKSTPIIVAVIDGGTDIFHPDLQANLWTNTGEVEGNGIDDDKNGYVDDLHGWNFIGGKNDDINHDNAEAVRVYNKFKNEFEDKSKSTITKNRMQDFEDFVYAKSIIDAELTTASGNLAMYDRLKAHLDKMKAQAGEEEITTNVISLLPKGDEEYEAVKAGVVESMANEFTFDQIYDDIIEAYTYFFNAVNFHYNLSYDPRKIVNDNADNYTERYYGNNNLKGPQPEHGTHVSGIIGAVRNNGLGINGVAENVKIMTLRVVPDGDERDKDVANAIRYAADAGAKIINMSFGKPLSPGKKYVDEAVRYAASKDVLLVHAAGNEASNNDKVSNYPNNHYVSNNTIEPAWIEVGAINSSGNIADFSNYGFKSVDVFAPGVSIYSTMPNGKYEYQDGTSMAAPVVTGLAALIRSYYPELNSVQVKQIITSSVIKVNYKTTYPGTTKKVKFKKLCKSGGFVNAYKAMEAAAALKK
jgi:subtilisin family serine protease